MNNQNSKAAEVKAQITEVKAAEVKAPKATLSTVTARTLVNRETIASLPKVYRAPATEIAKAIEMDDACTGLQAYYMYQIYKELATVGAEKPDGVKSIADFGEKVFGLAKAQSYNLAKAGSFIELNPVYDAKTNKIVKYTTNDVWGQYFSNTALVRIAEYIGSGETANARRTEVDEKIRLKLISGAMSISELKDALNRPIIDGKLGEKQDGKQDGKQGGKQDGKKDGKQGKADGKKKVVSFEMDEKKALQLKTELLKAIGSGYKDYPVISELINSMNNQFKANKK